MSFFRRLFGNDGAQTGEPSEEPVGDTPAAQLGDPYRGSLVAEVAEAPVRKATRIKPIWDSWTDVLALDLGDGGFPLRSIAYTGEDSGYYAVRRVTFVDDGVAVDWELALPDRDAVSEHLVVRVEDRIIVPRATGVVAVHVETGEPCWELPHPAKLYKAPRRTPSGDLILLFADQSWIELAPRDGAFRAEGQVRSDREADELLKRGVELNTRSSEEATRYGGVRVEIRGDGLRVERDGKGPPPPTAAQPIDRDRYQPPPPTIGTYPIDEWKPDDYLDLVHDKLAVRLSRTWGNKTRMAVGLLEPTSLEPLRLLELGDFESSSDFRWARVVDDLLVFYMDDLLVGTETPYAMFVIDTRAEAVLGCFVDGHPSHLFGPSGNRAWSGRL